MSNLRDLIHRVSDPGLKEQMLRLLEREGHEKPSQASFEPCVGITLNEVLFAVLSVPGVLNANVERTRIGYSTLIIQADVDWGDNIEEIAYELSKVLHNVLPVGISAQLTLKEKEGNLSRTYRVI